MLFDYLYLLLLGHILGDFYFQTEKIAKDKKYIGVILHSLVYATTIFFVMLPVISLDMILAAIYLSVMHFMIDTVQYILLINKKISKNGRTFVINQMFHGLGILLLTYIMYCWNFSISQFSLIGAFFDAYGVEKQVFIRWILTILILHIPTNILIQNLLTGYKPKENNSELIVVDHKVGRRIGTIERLIMLMFVALNQYAAMGLVLTAKSIARYEKIAKDERFAEYYLLGTLLSTASVVACKILFLQ